MFHAKKIISLLTITFCIIFYISQVPLPKQDPKQPHYVKRIISYSLRKSLELSSKSVTCNGSYRNQNKGNRLENNRWSLLEGTEFNFYSAYEDKRLDPFIYLRILGMVPESWNTTIFCSYYSKNGSVTTSKSSQTIIWADNWKDIYATKNYKPILISCVIPNDTKEANIYLSKQICDIKNLVFNYKKSSNIPKNSHKITICVKPLDFRENISKHLAEWLVFNKILGADFVYIYIKQVNETVLRFLKNYNNFVQINHYDNLGNSSWNIWQKRKHEILAYNDCFYKHIHTSKYVLLIDIDELVVPKKSKNWINLTKTFPDEYASYAVRNAYYFSSNRNSKPFFLQTFMRSGLSKPYESCKSFFSTANALTVFNHYALEGLKPGIGRSFFIGKDLAQVNHYKNDCDINLLPQCSKYISSPKIFDDIVSKFKEQWEYHFKYMFYNFSNFFIDVNK